MIRTAEPKPRNGMSFVDRGWTKGACDNASGNGCLPDPRTKRLRFFNVDNSNLRRARDFPGLTLLLYQRKRAYKVAPPRFGGRLRCGITSIHAIHGRATIRAPLSYAETSPATVAGSAAGRLLAGGRILYDVSPQQMASFARDAVAAGASLIGGCCGKTPTHVRASRSAI